LVFENDTQVGNGDFVESIFNLLKKLVLGGVGKWRRGRRAGQASTASASPPLHYLQPTSLISIGIGISAMFVVCSYCNYVKSFFRAHHFSLCKAPNSAKMPIISLLSIISC